MVATSFKNCAATENDRCTKEPTKIGFCEETDNQQTITFDAHLTKKKTTD